MWEGDPAPIRARSEARWPAPATRVWRWECPESQRTYNRAFRASGTAWTGWSSGRVSWRAWSRGAWRRRRRRSTRRRRRRRCGGRGVGGRDQGRRRCGRRCCWRCGSRGRAPPCGTARRSGRRRRWGGCGGRARGRAWGRGGRIFRSSRGRGESASRGGWRRCRWGTPWISWLKRFEWTHDQIFWVWFWWQKFYSIRRSFSTCCWINKYFYFCDNSIMVLNFKKINFEDIIVIWKKIWKKIKIFWIKKSTIKNICSEKKFRTICWRWVRNILLHVPLFFLRTFSFFYTKIGCNCNAGSNCFTRLILIFYGPLCIILTVYSNTLLSHKFFILIIFF